MVLFDLLICKSCRIVSSAKVNGNSLSSRLNLVNQLNDNAGEECCQIDKKTPEFFLQLSRIFQNKNVNIPHRAMPSWKKAHWKITTLFTNLCALQNQASNGPAVKRIMSDTSTITLYTMPYPQILATN